jgi:hypothetical protein
MTAVQVGRPWISDHPYAASVHARTRCPCSCYACKCTRRQTTRVREVEARKIAELEIAEELGIH